MLGIKNLLRRKLKRRENGFTLIELLTVMVVLTVLTTIAIPSVASYRTKSYNATSYSDLRNMCTAQEVYLINNPTYAQNVSDLIPYGYNQSPGVTAIIVSADTTSYVMTAKHDSGDKTWSVSGPGGTIQ